MIYPVETTLRADNRVVMRTSKPDSHPGESRLTIHSISTIATEKHPTDGVTRELGSLRQQLGSLRREPGSLRRELGSLRRAPQHRCL